MTVTFQQDLNGYTGTHDATIRASSPGSNYGQDANFDWDLDDGRFALLRFDAIFGSDGGQIPVGATILSATLTITMIDMTDAPAGSVHAVLMDWNEQDVTFNNFGSQPGVQIDDHGPSLVAAPLMTGPSDLEVTPVVQEWASSPASNRGWIVIAGSNNGANHHSSESAMDTARPRLVVEYLP